MTVFQLSVCDDREKSLPHPSIFSSIHKKNQFCSVLISYALNQRLHTLVCRLLEMAPLSCYSSNTASHAKLLSNDQELTFYSLLWTSCLFITESSTLQKALHFSPVCTVSCNPSHAISVFFFDFYSYTLWTLKQLDKVFYILGNMITIYLFIQVAAPRAPHNTFVML